MAEILPSTKTIASIKLPDYNSGKVTRFDGSNNYDLMSLETEIEFLLHSAGGAISPSSCKCCLRGGSEAEPFS